MLSSGGCPVDAVEAVQWMLWRRSSGCCGGCPVLIDYTSATVQQNILTSAVIEAATCL
ncbi:hypothetical protein AALO_G00034040 [Alosa alosa]|uniref:Uncharacterized protein n=1 Tax=Alosa alosa TaxID=278164 RepID=A0AAV6HGR6_9TELE|nr:hypothetical protein AALO_G00034040 [Alosa alosa]